MLTDPESNRQSASFRVMKLAIGDFRNLDFSHDYDIANNTFDHPDNEYEYIKLGTRLTITSDKGTRYAY